MKENPLVRLGRLGQSVWIDFIRRGSLLSGELRRLMEEDGVRGVTSNPAIFEKAIAGSHDYDETIRTLARQGKGVAEIYEALAVEDIRLAADLFRPIYDQEQGRDGYVSLEVNPHLAHDTARTVAEAHRLWAAVDRPNILIKVPGTPAGLAALEPLIGEGFNVNVTLLFSLPRYRQVIEAYLAGLEKRTRRGKALAHVTSVASFFLSRIDVRVDPMLEKIIQARGPKADVAASLLGQVASASAKVAYQIFLETVRGERFQRLATQGACSQRLLWASTGTKNPAFSDVKYIEPLIGPETINTMPRETMDAYRDHGNPAVRLTDGAVEAHRMLHRLSELGIDLDTITRQLETDGIDKFIKPFEALMDTLRSKHALPDAVPADSSGAAPPQG